MEQELKTQNIFGEKAYTIIFSIFYILGLLGVFYKIENILIFVVFIILSLLILFFNYGYRRSIILFLIFLLGISRANSTSHINNIKDLTNAKNVSLEGQIVSSRQTTADKTRVKFFLNVKNAVIFNNKYENLDSKVLIYLNADDNLEYKIATGDYISVKGTLRTPVTSTNPYQFDYQKYLSTKDCANILYGQNSTVKLIKEPEFGKNFNDSWYFILKKFEFIRNKIIDEHAKNIKSPKLEILAGLVFGNETINPDEKVKENFKNSGLLHLLAASGLNVALIYGIWWWIANLIRFPYNLSVLSGAGFVILYTFMTGFPPSILRASIMLLFVLFGKLIDRKASAVSLIFFVGFLILLFDPKMFFDIGFQLSFMVTFGLIYCCPVITKKFEDTDKKYKEKYKNSSRIKKYFLFLFSPQNLVSMVSIPLIAQLWVIPLQLHYFNNLAPLSVLANIAVVPFVGILSFIGFVSSILALLPKISSIIVFIFDSIANPLLTLLLKISEYFASFKFSLLNIRGFNIFQIFTFWGLIIILTLNIKNNFSKKYISSFVVLFIVFLLSFINLDYFKNNLEIIAFDVQNADSFLIKTPNKKYIMIDTGKKTYRGFDDGQMIISPYLRNKSIKKLDYLIITHFDSDHCGGTLTILKNFKVDKIIIQNENPKTKLSKEILQYLKENKLNYKIAENNETVLMEENLKIKTFTPFSNDENEASVVTLLNYKDKNVLFMADSGVEGFNTIQKFINQKIDILKVGHHGAQNVVNNEMIEKINPDYSIISTGANNFNHPHYSTINILQDNKSKIITTRNYGFLKIEFNQKDDNFNFYHYDKLNKKIEKINFDKTIEIPFNKTKYFKDFIKENI